MKNKKKNGFTLIELLAIIVILAIIAVITVPIILNIIDNSRKGAAIDSAYGYKDAVDKAYVQELAKPNQGSLKLNGTYEVQSDGTLQPATGSTFGVTNYNTLPVSVSGDKPTSGTLTYSNNVLTSGTLVIGDYTATYSNGSFTAAKTSAEVTETWDNYIYYSWEDGWVDNSPTLLDLSDRAPYFARTNTNKKQVCLNFLNDVVCFEPGLWDTEEQYNEQTDENEWIFGEYSQAKANEVMEAAGYEVTTNLIGSDGSISFSHGSSDMTAGCTIDYNTVSCGDASYIIRLYLNGTLEYD